MTTSRKVLAVCVFSLWALLLSLPAAAAQDGPKGVQASTGDDSASGRSTLPPQEWFSLHVESWGLLSSAEETVSRYRKKGLDSFYRSEYAGRRKGTWYRIYIGRYPTKAEAREAAAALIEQKVVDWFTLRKMSADAAQDGPTGVPADVPAPGGNSGSGHSTLHPNEWFSLQVEASVRLPAAEKAVSRYGKKGLDSFYRYEDTGSKGKWYRIYVGRYPTKAKAKVAAAALIKQKIVDSFILRKMSAGQDDGYTVGPQTAERPSANIETDKRGEASAPIATADPGPVQTTPGPVQTAPGPGLHETDEVATESPVVQLSLLDAIRYGLEGNREIDVVSYDPKKALTEIEGSESVYDMRLFADSTLRRDPNLESSVTDIALNEEMTTRVGARKSLITGGTISTYLELKKTDIKNSEIERTFKHIVAPTVELKQPLLNNIGSKKERTTIKIANYRANISDAEFRKKVIEVADQISRVYWKLYLYKEMVAINQKNLDLAEEVHRREAERFSKGISQRLAVERAKSNAQMRRSTWLDSVEGYHLAMDRLKLMLNQGPLNIDSDSAVLPVELPRISPVKVEESETMAKALDNRPEIIKAREQLMVSIADQELAAHQRLPTLDVFGRYSFSGYGDEGGDAWDDVSMDDNDAWEVGLRFEYAFGNRLANSSYKKNTLARLQANAQIQRIADDVKLEVKQVLKRLATLEDEIKANRSAKEAAEKVVEGEFARFDIGGTSNEELLRAQDLLAVTSRSLAMSIVDYNIAIHELTRVQGVLPEGITMDGVKTPVIAGKE
jgi:outer membrane protein TolC/septal ring-binding cell division protein DamX